MLFHYTSTFPPATNDKSKSAKSKRWLAKTSWKFGDVKSNGPTVRHTGNFLKEQYWAVSSWSTSESLSEVKVRWYCYLFEKRFCARWRRKFYKKKKFVQFVRLQGWWTSWTLIWGFEVICKWYMFQIKSTNDTLCLLHDIQIILF